VLASMDLIDALLAAYREMGVVRYAAKAADIARETALRWRREDEVFAEQFTEARADAADYPSARRYWVGECGKASSCEFRAPVVRRAIWVVL
jgi:hypothetical protein